jgi:hypothetical protein
MASIERRKSSSSNPSMAIAITPGSLAACGAQSAAEWLIWRYEWGYF